MKAVKSIITAAVTLAVIIIFIWWHFTFKIERKEGGILPHGEEGQVYIIKDSNPVFNFKIVYKSPEFSKEIDIRSGDYAVVLFNSSKKELYVYSDPQQMTLRTGGEVSAEEFSFNKPGIWHLMFGGRVFFKYGSHSLTLQKR